MSSEPPTERAPADAGRYPIFTPAMGEAARELAAGIGVPLRLEPRGRWDPAEEYWGEPDEPLADAFVPIVAAGARSAWELEQVIPGEDPERELDPILEAVELAGRGQRERARSLLAELIAADARCLDAHAHLGVLASEYSAALALPHFEAGVAIGERSLPVGFDGVLAWGRLDNRPFLRCLHGYGLCLWRLGRFAEAEAVIEAQLWLNPSDNVGVRELLVEVRRGVGWHPAARDEDPDPFGRVARRNLLDRAAAVVDAPPAALLGDVFNAAFAPLLWLLEHASQDGLPLTQTGALGRRIVREAAERFEGWWDGELFGPPHREADLAPLEELHSLLRRAGLLRKRRQRLLVTRRGMGASDEPEALLDALAPHLIDGDPFEREAAELACAVLLAERDLDRDRLAAIVHGALRRAWRRADGEPLTEHGAYGAIAPLLWTLIGLGVLPGVRSGRELALGEAGVELLARTLRHRATALG